MATQAKPDIYEPCKGIKRTKPDYEMDEELSKRIADEYRALPCFESTLFDQMYLKHYSLERNQLLKCRWKQYCNNISKRGFSPFQFPSNREIHFHNNNIKFRPSESVHLQPSYRMRLKPGPGVDTIGQIPIPNEMIMKRGPDIDLKKVKKVRAKTNLQARRK